MYKLLITTDHTEGDYKNPENPFPLISPNLPQPGDTLQLNDYDDECWWTTIVHDLTHHFTDGIYIHTRIYTQSDQGSDDHHHPPTDCHLWH